MAERKCAIIGAGPAGLTAAWELLRHDIASEVFEAEDIVGGIAQTSSYRGYRFDIGGHRFFTKVESVSKLWTEILGDDLLVRPRMSRIYYRGRFFDYPLKPMNALLGLGPIETMRIGLSYVKAQMMPTRDERNFEQWVTNRFGRRLYQIFFKTYTEKVWGIPCTEIGADWAAQRIKNLDLLTAVKSALLGGRSSGKTVTSLIERFEYPRLGPGMMWERLEEMCAKEGTPTHRGLKVTSIHHDGSKVDALTLVDRDGAEQRIEAEHFVSSMPLRNLIRGLDPPAPDDVRAAAEKLRYRDFLTVVLIVDQAELFPDNWIYIHSPNVRLGRIQNFKNWSPDMVPDPSKTALGLEYFVQEGDDLWTMDDAALVELGRRECHSLGLLAQKDVRDGTVVRMPKAYPVYNGDYKDALAVIQKHLSSLSNLHPIGRNGLHRYNNQDHSMVTAMYAARNIAGESLDVWNVNVEEEYHEESDSKSGATGERMIPQRVEAEQTSADLIRSMFARYDPVALGVACGGVAGLGLFLATVILLFGPQPIGPSLSLLGNYLLGYQASWSGAFIGLLEAGVGGFGFGYLLARLLNGTISFHERALLRRAEMARVVEMLDEIGM